jgi:hypothetical protein
MRLAGKDFCPGKDNIKQEEIVASDNVAEAQATE